MTTPELIATTRSLLQTQTFHQAQATHYLQLFNAHKPVDSNLIETVTPMQQFYQRMCEYHSAAAVTISQRIHEFSEIADC